MIPSLNTGLANMLKKPSETPELHLWFREKNICFKVLARLNNIKQQYMEMMISSLILS